MSGSEEILITVRPDGSITATTRQVYGARCLDYIAVLEDLLGAETIDSRCTADHSTIVGQDLSSTSLNDLDMSSIRLGGTTHQEG